ASEEHPAEQAGRHQHTNTAKRIMGVGLLAGSIAALAFEQSPGNEALRINRATHIIEQEGTPLDVAIDVAGVTMAIELGTSALIIAGLNQDGGVMNKMLDGSRDRKQRRDEARRTRKEVK